MIRPSTHAASPAACPAPAKASKPATVGKLSKTGTPKSVTTAAATPPRCPPSVESQPGIGRRIIDWLTSIGKPPPPIEQRFARKYLATLSPENAACLLGALALLDRVHGKPDEPNAFSAAFRKEGLEKLGTLSSNMRATIQVRLHRAAADPLDPQRQVCQAYDLLLAQLEEFKRTHDGADTDRKAQINLMHHMLDMMLEHKSVSEDDLRKWLLKLPASHKNEILGVESGETSRIGRLLKEERQAQAMRFVEAARLVEASSQGQTTGGPDMAACSKAIVAAGAELHKLIDVTGAGDGEAACNAVASGYAGVLQDLREHVKATAVANSALVLNLGTMEAAQFMRGSHGIGVATEAAPFKELAVRLARERDVARSARDGAMDLMIAAAAGGDFGQATAHLHEVARQYEIVRCVDDALTASPEKSGPIADLQVRDWAAGRVDLLASSGANGKALVEQLSSALNSPNAVALRDKWAEAPDSGTAPGQGEAPKIVLSAREQRTVQLMIESVREHASALHPANGHTSARSVADFMMLS